MLKYSVIWILKWMLQGNYWKECFGENISATQYHVIRLQNVNQNRTFFILKLCSFRLFVYYKSRSSDKGALSFFQCASRLVLGSHTSSVCLFIPISIVLTHIICVSFHRSLSDCLISRPLTFTSLGLLF